MKNKSDCFDEDGNWDVAPHGYYMNLRSPLLTRFL